MRIAGFAAVLLRGTASLFQGDAAAARLTAAASLGERMARGGVQLLAVPLGQILRAPPAPAPAPPRYQGLRVLQPLLGRDRPGLQRFVNRFAIVIVMTLATLAMPTPDGLSPEGHGALALFVFTGTILALEPVSLPFAALMVPIAVVALGTGTTEQAFETFSRPVVFLVLASLFLAEVLRTHKLTRRLALLTIVASGGEIRRLLFGLMLIAAVLSMWVENTATAAVLIPVALTISRQISDPAKARSLLVLLVLGIAYSASVGGMVTITGAASNAVASGFLTQIMRWTFVDWLIYGLPAFLLIFPLTYWILVRMAPIDVKQIDIEPAREELVKLGPMIRSDYEILGVMIAAAFFWITGSFIEPALGLPPTFLSAAMVAVVAVAYLAVRGLLSWDDVKGVSWGIFLIIGAGLALGEALNRTGATGWFADIVTPLVVGPPLIVSLLLMTFMSALLTNVMNNTTIAAVFVPILISLAQSDPSFNAVQLVLPVTLATTFGYSLPSASGRMALIAATGIVSRGEMMRYGLIVTGASTCVLALFFYVLAVLGWI
jgi:solute carrier family 13 (sodium-dependent dicarboxylate transporter), member 2/3/5